MLACEEALHSVSFKLKIFELDLSNKSFIWICYDKDDGVVNPVTWTIKSIIFKTHLCVLDLVSYDDGQFINFFVTFVHLTEEYLEILRSLVLFDIDIRDKITSVKNIINGLLFG